MAAKDLSKQQYGAAYRLSRGPMTADSKRSPSTPLPGAAGETAPVLGRILKRARVHNGYTLRDIERSLQVPNAHLSQIERGKIRRPDPAVLWSLAEFFSLDYDLLLHWAGYYDREHSGPPPQVAVAIKLLSQMEDDQRTRAIALLQAFWDEARPRSDEEFDDRGDN